MTSRQKCPVPVRAFHSETAAVPNGLRGPLEVEEATSELGHDSRVCRGRIQWHNMGERAWPAGWPGALASQEGKSAKECLMAARYKRRVRKHFLALALKPS